MIDTLRAIANATPQSQPRRSSSRTACAEPHHAIPLTADSLGAQLLLTMSEQVGEISRDIADRRAVAHALSGVLLLARAHRQRSRRL